MDQKEGSMKRRRCNKCKSSDHMTRDRDGVIDTRFRVCFKCEFTLQDELNDDWVYFEMEEREDTKEAA
jgi:NAD-dependent SIR2 family protein deacetylase